MDIYDEPGTVKDRKPVDFYKTPFILNHYYTLYFKISDVGTEWYQGDVVVVAKAEYRYQGNLLTFERNITTRYISVTPNTPNEFAWSGKLDSALLEGRPIYATGYSVTIELRDPSNGYTLYTMHFPVTIAYDTTEGPSTGGGN
jgi:hypothetical protein